MGRPISKTPLNGEKLSPRGYANPVPKKPNGRKGLTTKFLGNYQNGDSEN